MDGVYHVLDETGDMVTDVPAVEEFYEDFHELTVALIFFTTRAWTFPWAYFQIVIHTNTRTIQHLLNSGPVKTYSYKRLQVLEARFHLHKLLNSDRELEAQKSVPHRYVISLYTGGLIILNPLSHSYREKKWQHSDFYNIRKVDTHVHHSACMHLKHLLRFIKHKLKTCGGEIVAFRDGQFMTLKEVFQVWGPLDE